MKDKGRKKMLGRWYFSYIYRLNRSMRNHGKTTNFASTPQEGKLSLHGWLLLIMLDMCHVSWCMTIGSLAAHHNKHRKHDWPSTYLYTNFRKFLVPEKNIAIHTAIKQYQALSWSWMTWWYRCNREKRRNNDLMIIFYRPYIMKTHIVT